MKGIPCFHPIVKTAHFPVTILFSLTARQHVETDGRKNERQTKRHQRDNKTQSTLKKKSMVPFLEFQVKI